MDRTKTIRVSVLGRPYPLLVEDEHEEFTRRMAAMVEQRAREVERQAPGHTPLTHMALTALSLGEELLAVREEIASLRRIEAEAEELSARLDAALENGSVPAEEKASSRKKPAAKRANPARKATAREKPRTGRSDDPPAATTSKGDAQGDATSAGAASTKTE